MSDIWIAIISIVGVMLGTMLGAGLNELFRQRQRIEAYAVRVFDKRLEKYEELMALLQAAYLVASDVMQKNGRTSKQRIDAAVFPIVQFLDDNELYIDEELGIHCIATFMGAEDVQDTENPQERKKRQQEIYDKYKDAKRMIREDSGIAKIDKMFKGITKPRLSGSVIEYVRYLKNHPEAIRKIDEEETEDKSNNEMQPAD